MLDQVINAASKLWSNVGEKEAFSIVLTTGAPGPNAPTVVSIKKNAGSEILTLYSLSSSFFCSTMDLRRKGGRISNRSSISVSSYSIGSFGVAHF